MRTLTLPFFHFIPKQIILLLFSVCALKNVSGQATVSSSPGVITFQRYYSLPPANQILYGMDQTSDSGFIAIGQILNNSSFTYDAYVQRSDKYGNLLWTKSLGQTGFNFERGEDIHQTSDGGFIGAGSTSANSGNMYLFKLDAAGNLSWVKSFGDFFGVPSTEYDAHVVQTNDGGYMFTSGTDSIGSTDYTLLSVVKVDAGGALQWEKHYDSFADSTHQSAGDIIKTMDGNYAVSGLIRVGSNDPDILLFKLNPNGDTLWTKNYDLGNGEGAAHVRQALDGGYLLGGNLLNVSSSDSGSYLLKVDSLGNVQWSKSYVNTALQAGAFFIDVVSDGGYMLGGYSGLPASFNWNEFLIKTNSTGDTLWTKRYGLNPNDPGVAWAGMETNDRGFVVGGSNSVSGNSNIYLVKTDSLGRSGCTEQAYPIVTAALAVNGFRVPYHVYSTAISNIPAVTVNSWTPVPSLVCCHVPLEITGNDTICTGSTVTLTAKGAYSYLWSNGANTPSITVTANADTSFSVQGFSGPAFTCQSLTFNITTVTLTPAITGNTTICNGSSTTLTASGGNSFLWDNNATTSSITVSPSVNTTYTVITTTGYCSDSATAAVIVNPVPAATINSPDSLCSGQNAVLTAGGGGTYLWNNSATTSSITTTPSTTTNYYVIVSNGMCEDTAFATVIVNPNPAVIISGINSICAGDNTTLTATGANSFVWSTGPSTSSITVNPPATTIYSVTGTNTSGCTGTASTTVTVTPNPVAAISGPSTICSGSGATLTASGGSAYAWSTSATSASISVSPTTATTYSVIVSNGVCSDTAYHSMTILTPPTAAVTSSTDSILQGGNTTLTATGGGTYSWNPSSGLSCATCQNPTADPLQTTTYCVTVTDANGCTDNACTTIFVNTECGELFVPNAFSPNNDHENDVLKIYGTQCIQTLSFVIYDRWGEKVFEATDPSAEWDGIYKGQLMNSAVFVYQLEGVTYAGNPVSKKGNITLIR